MILDLNELVAIRPQGNYVILLRETDYVSVREPITVLAQKLKPYGFIRIHRSVVVNRSYVDEVRSLPTGEYRMRVGTRQFTVTRTYKSELSRLAGLWIGMDALGGNTVKQR